MGQHGNAAGGQQFRDALLQAHPGGRHEAGLAFLKETVERVALIAHHAGFHQHFRKPGPPRGVAVGQLAGLAVAVFQPGRLVQAGADAHRPLAAGLQLTVDPLHQHRRVRVHPQAEHVDFPAAAQHRQLDARHQGDAVPVRGAARLGQAGQGVVVGERQGVDAVIGGAGHQIGGRQHAVRGQAVAVEIGALETGGIGHGGQGITQPAPAG